MSLSEFSVKRPIGICMVFCFLIVLGYVSYKNLVVDLLPDITFPVIAVITPYPGVAPEEVENLVTKPIEEVVGRAEKIKKISSISQAGLSIVIAEFDWGVNLDFGVQDIREKLDLISEYLPEEVSNPAIMKMDIKGMPVMFMGITGKRTLFELRNIARDYLEKEIEKVEGIAAVQIMGGEERQIKVLVDQEKLDSYSLPISQVYSSLQVGSINLSGGFIKEGIKENLIRIKGEFESLLDIENTVVGERGNIPIYLKDVAEIKEGFKERRNLVRLNNEEGVGIVVFKQADANSVKVVDRLKDKVEKVKKHMPSEVKVIYSWDQAKLIKMSIGAVKSNAKWGILFAILIIYLFLRSYRATIIIGLTVPIAIITTFILMFFADLSINMMSLGGLALGVGILVDNSIIVLESIYRHLSLKRDEREASIAGSKEVVTAISASTFTTICVFLPIAFISGIVGELFKEMALTVAFSLLTSLFVALTLTPMLCSVLLKKEAKEIKYKGEFLNFALDIHDRALSWGLNHRFLTILIVFIMFLSSLGLVKFIGKEFLPDVEGGDFMVKVKLPVGVNINETNKVVRVIENKILSYPEVSTAFCQLGLLEEQKEDIAFGSTSTDVNEGIVWADLRRRGKIKDRKTKKQIQEEMRSFSEQIPNTDVQVIGGEEMLFSGEVGRAIEVIIYGDDKEILQQYAKILEDRINKIEGIVNVEVSFKEGKPEFQIYVDRIRSANLGFTVGEIASCIEQALKGRVVTKYRRFGKEIDVFLRLEEDDRNKIEKLKNLILVSRYGKSVRLGEVSNVKRAKAPDKIERESHRKVVRIISSIAGRDLGSVTEEVKRVGDSLSLLPGYSLDYSGKAKQMSEAFEKLLFALTMAILLVYIVLAFQFESLVHPLVIMFTTPLVIIGVLFILFITKTTLCITSLIGLIMVVGIGVNDGIVLVDYTNQLRARGKEKREAILEAGSTRLRPVLLTSFTTILALTPMAIGLVGEGAEMNIPLSLAIIGGLTTATVLTLVVIPVIYSILDEVGERIFGSRFQNLKRS